MQSAKPAPTGVCIVRVEPRDDGVRVTVILNPDVTQRSKETSREYSELTDALAGIERFLRALVRGAAR
jgi:hypothetical protein